MKNEFPEHYTNTAAERDLSRLIKGQTLHRDYREQLVSRFSYPSEAEREALWKDCYFVFDANSLTHLYQMPNPMRDRFFEILRKVRDRIWLPFHAATEYHDHIADSVNGACRPITDLIEFKGAAMRLAGDVAKKYKAHHWFNVHAFQQQLEDRIDDLIAAAKQHRDKLLATYTDTKATIADIFDGCVESSKNSLKLEDVENEGQRRLNIGVPPACEDDAKKKTNKFGDVAIWLAMLEFAKTKGKPIIFVTDDVKENWFLIDARGTVGARPELCLEMQRETGQEFLGVFVRVVHRQR